MKNLTLFLAITTLFFSCKKEEKPLENTILETKPEIIINTKTEDFLGTWLAQSIGNNDFDSLEIDKKTLHLYYSQGEIALNYESVANEMILTFDYVDLKINYDGDDCHGKKVGKLYKDNLGNLVLEINTNGLKCGEINNGKLTFQRGVSAAIIDVEKAPDTIIDFDIFSVSILGFESEIDETAKNSPKNTISLLDKTDDLGLWGLTNKKIKILSQNKNLKFDLEYCSIEELIFFDDRSTACLSNTNYDKLERIGNSEFLFIDFDETYYTKCEKEFKQKLQLKDTLVEIDYEIAKLSYKGKPVFFVPKFILLKITATDLKGIKTIRFLKIEIYEGGC